jgi:hypothetical protein
MGIRMVTRGLWSMRLKRKINEIKTTVVGIFKNMHSDRVDQSDQSGTGQVQSLIKNYERMKESETGHLPIPKLRNVYKFGNNTEITFESPSKKIRLGQDKQAGSMSGSPSSDRRSSSTPRPPVSITLARV